jgi:hypothetical protein
MVSLLQVIYATIITKMQRQSHGNEQKLVNEKIITSQFLTKDSLNEQENASSKVSPYV